MAGRRLPGRLNGKRKKASRFGIAVFSIAVPLIADVAQGGQGEALKIVTFGTSLTARGGWQSSLGEALARCLSRPVQVESVALSGSTTEWALKQTKQVAKAHPDVILIELYVNDSAINRWISPSTSRRNIALVLDRLRDDAPNAKVVMMAMNPISGLRGWLRPFLGAYLAAHREEAEKRDLHFVDFGPSWNSMSAAELDDAIPDGAHPRPQAASGIMVPALVSILAPGACPEAE